MVIGCSPGRRPVWQGHAGCLVLTPECGEPLRWRGLSTRRWCSAYVYPAAGCV